MTIELKNYTKTKYVGVYESKESYGDVGKKFIGKFQFRGKKHIKVLGYSFQDKINASKAYKLLLDYKEKTKTDFQSKEKDYVDIKKNIFPYYNLINDKSLIRTTLKRLYEKEKLKPYQVELIKLQNFLKINKQKVIVLFEGRDASGKGGIIRRITKYMDIKHYRTIALGKPNELEKAQWYFQRYIEKFPANGEMILFDRSWYNRAMVEPVFGFCTPKEYKNFMNDVNSFERNLVNGGITLVKLYFSIKKETQQFRFKRRENNPLKNWKLSEIDLQAQELWENFSEKKENMLRKTSTDTEPWIIIKSDDKGLATMEAIKVILNSINYKDKNKHLDYVSDKKIVFSSKEELKTMRQIDK